MVRTPKPWRTPDLNLYRECVDRLKTAKIRTMVGMGPKRIFLSPLYFCPAAFVPQQAVDGQNTCSMAHTIFEAMQRVDNFKISKNTNYGWNGFQMGDLGIIYTSVQLPWYRRRPGMMRTPKP
jgi:hypothetical protein